MAEILEVELRISEGNAEVVLGKAKQKLEDFVQTAEKAQPEIKLKVSGGSFIDLDKMEKRAEETRKSFAAIAAQRLDAGQVGLLTKEMIRASERSRQLSSDIASIKKELANPARKSSIAFLIDELRAAESEAEQLNRKLNSLPSGGGRQFDPARGNASGGGSLKLSGFQKQNLSYQINDVATMAAMGANPMQIIASQAGQIAQIFDPAQIAAFTAKYTSLVTVLGAGAAAIALTYKITGDIRAEAERLLKVEEQITGARNNQILASKKLREELQKSRDEAEEDRRYQSTLDRGATVEDLIKRRENLLRLQNLTPESLPTLENGKVVQKENETFTRNAEQLKRYDADIYALREKREKAAADAFNNRFKLETKSQESEIKAQERAVEAQKKVNEQIEKAKNLLIDTRDFLVSVNPSENPLVKMMSDFDTATTRAEKKFADFKKVLNPDAFKKFIGEMASLDRAKNLQQQAKTVYESHRTALGFEQDGVRVSRIKDTQFDSFRRAVETVEQKVDFALKINQLNRQIDETSFYASRYNPNNPKSFEEMRRRFIGDDPAIRSALKDAAALKNIDSGKTGIYGEAAIADEMLKILPALNDLTAALNDPKLASDARFLLNQRLGALQTQKEFAGQKLKDFLYEQETSGLNRKFAYEQINLLNQQTGLSQAEKAKRFLDITKPLGNDIDPTLRRGIYQADMIAAREERFKEDEARKLNNRIETYIKAIAEKITNGQIQIDPANLPASTLQVGVEVKDSPTSKSTVTRATPADAGSNMDSSYRIGDVHAGGDLRGAIIIG